METDSSSKRNEEEAGGLSGNGDEENESKLQSSKYKVCFIHSARLLETMDTNPRFTGRVRPIDYHYISNYQRTYSCLF